MEDSVNISEPYHIVLMETTSRNCASMIQFGYNVILILLRMLSEGWGLENAAGWSEDETLKLIDIWGEDTIQA